MEKMRFEGKVVIVTGASSGIGRSTARLFAMEGAKVVAAARRLKRLEDLRDKVAAENAPGVILPVKTDVRDPAQIEAMFDTCLKEFGHLDILVNNAGVLDGQLPIHETTPEVYDMIYETNQRAVFLCCQRAIRIFLEQGTPANIVNVASAASLRGLKGGAMLAFQLALAICKKSGAFFCIDEDQRNTLIVIKKREMLIDAPIVGYRQISQAVFIVKSAVGTGRASTDIIQE